MAPVPTMYAADSLQTCFCTVTTCSEGTSWQCQNYAKLQLRQLASSRLDASCPQSFSAVIFWCHCGLVDTLAGTPVTVRHGDSGHEVALMPQCIKSRKCWVTRLLLGALWHIATASCHVPCTACRVIGQARNAYKPRHGPIETISLAASQNKQRHRFHCIDLDTRMVSP